MQGPGLFLVSVTFRTSSRHSCPLLMCSLWYLTYKLIQINVELCGQGIMSCRLRWILRDWTACSFPCPICRDHAFVGQETGRGLKKSVPNFSPIGKHVPPLGLAGESSQPACSPCGCVVVPNLVLICFLCRPLKHVPLISQPQRC